MKPSARSILGFLLAGLLLALAACVPGPAPRPQPRPVSLEQEVVALLDLGARRLDQGRNQEAADAFRAALKLKPVRKYQARALLGLARVEKAQGRNQAALELVQRMLERAWDPDLAMEAEILAARLELDLGRGQRAASRLRRVLARPPGPMDQELRRRLRRMLAQALEAAGDYGQAAAVLVEQARRGDAALAAHLAPELARVAAKAPVRELKPLLPVAAWPRIRAALLLGLVRAHLRRGELEQAESTLEQLRASPAATVWQEQIKELDSQVSQARLINPRAVGVILPLSGPYAAYGRQVLAAVELGLGLFGQAGGNPPTLFIQDSRSNPQAAARAVSTLVERHRVIAIIGPMGAATSLAAARRAQELGVPLIALSQVQGVTLAGDYVFQNFFTPSEQVDVVLDEMMGARALRRVAVMAPANSYGRGFAKLIAAGVARRGGELVRTIYYDPHQTDFSADIKRLVHLPPGNYRPGHPDSPKPVIDFQCLFIPDGPDRAAMIAPQLAYFDVVGVDLLGTSLWHNPKFLEMGGRYLEGSVFPGAFAPQSPDQRVRRFVDDFRQALGVEPNVLSAHGYDAALVVRRILSSPSPPRTRAAFRDDLAGVDGVPGVCGLLRVGPDRRLRKKLKLFTIRDGRFRLLQDEGQVPPPQLGQGSEGAEEPAPPSPQSGSSPQPRLPPAATIPR